MLFHTGDGRRFILPGHRPKTVVLRDHRSLITGLKWGYVGKNKNRLVARRRLGIWLSSPTTNVNRLAEMEPEPAL